MRLCPIPAATNWIKAGIRCPFRHNHFVNPSCTAKYNLIFYIVLISNFFLQQFPDRNKMLFFYKNLASSLHNNLKSGTGILFWLLILLPFSSKAQENNGGKSSKSVSAFPFGKWKPYVYEVVSPSIPKAAELLDFNKELCELHFAGKPEIIFNFNTDGKFQIDTSYHKVGEKMGNSPAADIKTLLTSLTGRIRPANLQGTGEFIIQIDKQQEKQAILLDHPQKQLKIKYSSKPATASDFSESGFQPKSGDSLQMILVLVPIEDKVWPSPEKISNKPAGNRVKELLPGAWKAETAFLWNPADKGKEAKAGKIPNPPIPWLLLNSDETVYFDPTDRYELLDNQRLKINIAKDNIWESSEMKISLDFGMEEETTKKKRTETIYKIKYISKDSLILSYPYMANGLLGLLDMEEQAAKLECLIIFSRELPPASEPLWQQVKITQESDQNFRPLAASGSEILGYLEGSPLMGIPGKLAVLGSDNRISELKDGPELGNSLQCRMHSSKEALILDAGNALYVRKNPLSGWEKIELPAAPAELTLDKNPNLFAANSNRIFCTTNKHMFQSTDLGKTWTKMPAQFDSICSFFSLEEHKGKMILQAEKFRLRADSIEDFVNDTVKMVATFTPESYPVLFYSQDGGNFWQSTDSISFCNAFICDRFTLFRNGIGMESSKNPLQNRNQYFGKGLPIPKIFKSMAMAETEEEKSAVIMENMGTVMMMGMAQQMDIPLLHRTEKGIFYQNLPGGLYFSSDEGLHWKEAGSLAMRQKITSLVCTPETIYVWTGKQMWKASLNNLADFMAK